MTPASTRDCVLFASQRYAWPILAPMAAALREVGFEPHTLALDGAQGGGLSGVPQVDLEQAVALRPRTVFSASNWVPTFLTGAKVQLFHGFNVQKRENARGHFRVRGLFDLYCTQGPATTEPFLELARKEGHFAVVETGWPKLDPLFAPEFPQASVLRDRAGGRPVVMFASTFTESLSAAPHLLDAIAAEIARGEYYWLLTLHPKLPDALAQRYRALQGSNAHFIEPEDLVAAERAAEVLLADTTSVVSEFVAQRKPVVTFRNRVPQPHMLDFDDPARVRELLGQAFAPTPELIRTITDYADHIHPARDGHAAQRVVQASEALLRGDLGTLRRKPPSAWWRRLEVRAKTGYWRR